jgi:hypothetical protein
MFRLGPLHERLTPGQLRFFFVSGLIGGALTAAMGLFLLVIALAGGQATVWDALTCLGAGALLFLCTLMVHKVVLPGMMSVDEPLIRHPLDLPGREPGAPVDGAED